MNRCVFLCVLFLCLSQGSGICAENIDNEPNDVELKEMSVTNKSGVDSEAVIVEVADSNELPEDKEDISDEGDEVVADSNDIPAESEDGGDESIEALAGFDDMVADSNEPLAGSEEVVADSNEPLAGSEEVVPDSNEIEGLDLELGDAGFFDLSLSEIMDIEVISVTRTKGQNVLTSPAAIYVITQEDIQRSGLRSIPEILRLAPGVQVSRIRADQWAISIRGFDERFSDKLLVQIDGRTIYNMVFSGVLWEVQDYVLDDIERIEVIRGPGASLWGANAVHGIINIITKKAEDTEGRLLDIGGGNYDAVGSFRQGKKHGENGHWRAWRKYKHSDNYPRKRGDFTDDYGLHTMGFRYDWDDKCQDALSVELGGFCGKFSTLFPKVDLSAGTNTQIDTEQKQYGGNIRGAWERKIDETSSMKLQTYLNLNSFTVPNDDIDFRTDWNLFDVDFQHNFLLCPDHSIVWGLGYRRSDFDSRGSETLSYIPSSSNANIFSGFIQDSFPIYSDKLKGTVGIKLEHHDFTGFEYQPTARIMYQHDKRQAFWAAYSRAIRTPNYTNRDVFLNRFALGGGNAVTLRGNRDIESERINSYEAGYRSILNENLSLDVTGYVMKAKGITDISPVTPLSFEFKNDIKANTEGIELALEWQVSDSWRIKGSYSWFHMDIFQGGVGSEDNTPQNMASLFSHKNFGKDVSLNTNLFFNDDVEFNSSDTIEDWIRCDVGLVWQACDHLEFSFWGQNLFDSGHQEFVPDDAVNAGISYIPRSFFFQMKYNF